MQTVLISETGEVFTKLLRSLGSEPLVVVDGDQEVAIIKSAAAIEQERREGWNRFWKVRDAFAAEVEANLARDGITVEQFLEDVLKDE